MTWLHDFQSKIRFVIVLLACQSLTAQAQVTPRLVGIAYDLESGELVYTEEHFYEAEEGRHEVLYRSKNDDIFARKTLDYSNGLTVPSFDMTNDWSGEAMSLQWQNQKLIGEYASQVRDIKRGPDEIDQSKKRALVVDAGFDAFVKQHWGSLLSGKTIEFDYVLPTRLRAAPLEITYVDSGDDSNYKFEIKSSVRVLNLFFDPIELRYNPQRQLTEFNGQSNIADETGRYLSVRIRYDVLE